ncbi:MAG TPA: hypothetical protein VHB51_02895 [Candidatus Saccharimonadales bacterium]|nr:hypothetical protein [Candidatus Saccharimonadales bacterium]
MADLAPGESKIVSGERRIGREELFAYYVGNERRENRDKIIKDLLLASSKVDSWWTKMFAKQRMNRLKGQNMDHGSADYASHSLLTGAVRAGKAACSKSCVMKGNRTLVPPLAQKEAVIITLECERGVMCPRENGQPKGFVAANEYMDTRLAAGVAWLEDSLAAWRYQAECQALADKGITVL